MSNFIRTYSKIKFYPLEAKIEDIHIIDIAHALSLMTRANGHLKHFYSVAQHSVNCYKEAKNRGYSKRVQLGCLLHDASESYISDLTRPVKKNFPKYYVIEEKLQNLIYEKYGIGDLSKAEIKQIRDIDDGMLYYEFLELMSIEVIEEKSALSMTHDFNERGFKSVENEFIKSFNRLMKDDKGYSSIGIDGYKGKWIAVHISDKGFDVNVFHTITEICSQYPDVDSYLIDIPIGLPESMTELRPDSLVKKQLGKKGSSIFSVPCRQAVYAGNYEKARAFNKQVLGKSLSAQSLAITKAIKQVDMFLSEKPQWQNKLLESHPEFCFMKLNNNQPILENKKTKEGQEIRLDVLKRYYMDADNVIDKFLNDVPYRKKIDDVIDALCLAIMGKEMLETGVKTIHEEPEMDSRGLLMQMVYGG